jgi:hypothetical protein
MNSQGQSQFPQPAEYDPGPAQRGRLKWGRLICLAGALGLCVSLFMPQVGLSIDVLGPTWLDILGPTVLEISPVRDIQDGTNLAGICLPFLAAVLLLPFLAFRAVPRLDAANGAGKFLAWAQCVICLTVLVIGLAWAANGVVEAWLAKGGVRHLFYVLPPAGILWLGLALVALVRCRLPRKVAAAQFALWVYYLTFFIYLAIPEPTNPNSIIYAGIWLSIASSCALVIGSAIDWFQCRPSLE